MIDNNQRLPKLYYSHLIKLRSLNLLVPLYKVRINYRIIELTQFVIDTQNYIFEYIFLEFLY